MAVTTSALEERQINAEYGEIWHAGYYQGDLVEFSGRVSIERREIPVAGQDKVVYRRGRVGRDGSVRISKVDSRFEALVIYYANLSVQDRRNLRGQGIDPFPATELILKLDDPDSWGAEEIKLTGVRFWETALGFGGNSIIQRDVPTTWDREQIVAAVPRPGNKQGATPPAGLQTYGGYGGNTVI
jgi:hypothetical protein